MKQAPTAVTILNRIAPDAARSGIVFAVAPERIALAPWLDPRSGAASAHEQLARALWTYGLAAPLVGRAVDSDRFELLAEPEFLEAARVAGLRTVRLLAIDIDDALGRAIAIAARVRNGYGAAGAPESLLDLGSALERAGLKPTPEMLASITLRDEESIAHLLNGSSR